VYFSDTGGNTYAYTLDGEPLWVHDGAAPVLVAPALAEGEGLVVVTNVDDLALALAVDTGELKWQYRARRDLTRQAELALYAAPQALIVGDEVVLGFSNGSVVGVDLATGEELWQRGVGEGRYPDVVADPVTAGDDVFTSGYFRPLVALDLPSRNVRWRVEAGAAHPVALDERDGNLVVYHPGTDGRLLAISALTGAQLWMWDSKTSGALTTPQVTEAGLLVASSEGEIYLIDPETGRETWRWHEPWQLRGISSVPVVNGRQVVFVSNAGFLYSMLSPRPTPPPDRLWPRPR
jgi:outer membrane protein assembly factor BamB